MLWIVLLYNKQYFWFGMIILRILFESNAHKNISLPLQIMLNNYPCTKQVIMFFMFSTIKTFTVNPKNYGLEIEDIGSKEGVQHGQDIIAAVNVKKQSTHETGAYKNLGTTLVLLYML